MNTKRKILSTAALVAFLVACGGGGGVPALADVTDAMFNALASRVTANESAIATLQTTQAPNLVDANGTIVGPVVGRGNGGTAQVAIVVNGIDYVATFGPGGTWRPKQTYHTEPTCNLSASLFVDQREIESGFWFLWSPGDFNPNQSGFYDLVPANGNVIPGWIKDGFGSCTAVQNPRLKFYASHFVGASDIYQAPFTVGL